MVPAGCYVGHLVVIAPAAIMEIARERTLPNMATRGRNSNGCAEGAGGPIGPAHFSNQPALFGFGTGFLPPETDAQKGAGDDVSKRRPEIGDHDAREMAAKTAFLLASCQLRVSEDWVVGAPGLVRGTR